MWVAVPSLSGHIIDESYIMYLFIYFWKKNWEYKLPLSTHFLIANLIEFPPLLIALS